ncbi:MAG: glycosyltransferase [Bacteroidetes bacterium]|jgi:glycosyltransferase involved in cell wall biosynthesis|nr:glycosyltransferase [Bacteroidota bacterium]
MPLVSIVLCTFNGEKFIKEQIESILSQTYTNFELIICDDNSTDSTAYILEGYAQKDDRIKLLMNNKKLGYIKNFEKGIAQTRGEYIALSDQDDIWNNDKILKLQTNIKDNCLIYSDSLIVNRHLKPLGKKMSTKKNMISTDNVLSFCLENSVSGHALMFKKSLLNNLFPFPPQVPHDWWISFNAALIGKVKYLDETLVQYRIHNNNALVRNLNRKSKFNKIEKKQIRIHTFYKKIPENHPGKQLVYDLNTVYHSLSIKSKLKKTSIFLKHKKMLFAIKKKKGFTLVFYILKQFNKLK